MNKKEQTCCFTGHRQPPAKDFPIKIKDRLYEAVEQLIQQEVIYFGAGGAVGFDTLAAQTVLQLRCKYPAIKLILVLPCRDQTEGWPKADIATYEGIVSSADKVVYTSDSYSKGCMHKRNRHLVDNSRYCICYLIKHQGGSAYTVDYARSKGLSIYNLADTDVIRG